MTWRARLALPVIAAVTGLATLTVPPAQADQPGGSPPVVGRAGGDEVTWGTPDLTARSALDRARWRFERLSHRHHGPCTWVQFEATRLVGGGGRHVFLQEKWGRRPWQDAYRQTATRFGRFDFDDWRPSARRRYRTRTFEVDHPAYHGGSMRWTQRVVVPGDDEHLRYVGPTCTVTLG